MSIFVATWLIPRSRSVLALLLMCLSWTLTVAAESPAAVPSRESPACRVVRLADIGWTDVTATTALLSSLLTELGYDPHTTVLSVPVTFASLQRGDLDVFLGNWMPAQEAQRRPYITDGSVEVIGINLSGAKFTLAVPAYGYDSGLRDFADIQRFAPALKNTIYGIEPGSPGNRLILRMLQQDRFGLGSFRLIESSEQAMLSEVERAVRVREPIVFLAWDPHPMNLRFDLRYLTGGDAIFGADFGGATVYTLVRHGYAASCPNVASLLRNLRFTTQGESEVMSAMLERHAPPEDAARQWLQSHPDVRQSWLTGVRTFDAAIPGSSLNTLRRDGRTVFDTWVRNHKVPVGAAAALLVEYVKAHGAAVLSVLAAGVRACVQGLNSLLRKIPSALLVLLLAALTWGLHRSISLALFVTLALLFIMNQGYWAATLETLSLVLVATSTCVLIGVPLGIAAAHRPRLHAVLRPVLDLMQTLPTFVYLIPTLVLFGLGVVPGLISTVIFALPAIVRMTQLGVSSVPRPLREAGQAFGATPWQLLWKVELPSAAPELLAGVNQCIMLSLSMVVIAALVGAGGLGVPVVRALSTVQIGIGFEAGFVIVLLAIILDRVCRPRSRR